MTPTESSPGVHRKRLLAVLLLPMFMALVAISVLNVALPAIETTLHASTTALQWTISGYALMFGLFLVPSGRAGDATGRKRLFMIGVSVFTAGALLSALAPNSELLIVARLLQGAGSGLLNPQIFGLIQRHFQGQQRATAFAFIGTTVAVATAVGPLIGGLLIELFGSELGWRMIFGTNVPLGIFAVLAAWRWIPKDRVRTQTRLDLDPVGTVLLALGILAVMVPFMLRSAPWWVFLLVPIGVGFFLLWGAWEKHYKRRGREPMVDMAVLQQPAFRNGIIIITVYFLGVTSVWILVPLYLINHLELTPFQASLAMLPSSVVAMFSSQLGGRYVLRLGRRMVAAGFALAFLSLVLVGITAPLVENDTLGWAWFAVPLCLLGFSQGLTIGPNQTITLSAVDPRFGGVAGGILSLGQRIGAAVGLALIPGILFSLTQSGTPWLPAFLISLAVIGALVLGAFGITLFDRRREKRDQAAPPEGSAA